MKKVQFLFHFKGKEYYAHVIKSASNFPIYFIASFENIDLIKVTNSALFIQESASAEIVPAGSSSEDERLLKEILLPIIIEKNEKGRFEGGK